MKTTTIIPALLMILTGCVTKPSPANETLTTTYGTITKVEYIKTNCPLVRLGSSSSIQPIELYGEEYVNDNGLVNLIAKTILIQYSESGPLTNGCKHTKVNGLKLSNVGQQAKETAY